MEQEDNEFFILVLGVLAAIILVISWWFTTGGFATSPSVSSASTSQPSDDASAAATDHDDDADHDDDDDDDADDADHADDADDADHDDTDTASDASAAEATSDVPVVDAAASVFDAIAGDDRFGVFNGLIRSEGLDILLSSEGPFTVFAPTDDAISDAAASDTTVSVLETARTAVLEYHVIRGMYTLGQLTDIARGSRSTELMTLQGESISLSLDGTKLVVNGTAVVDNAPRTTGNGVLHTLDNVLVPPVAALNALVDLEPILFASGSDQIDPQSFATLDRFTDVLLASPANVTIEGHTDSSGDALLNQNLSQSRARSVLNYLVAAGVDESHLTAQGFGSSSPVADNETEAGRALNRRIEFTVN